MVSKSNSEQVMLRFTPNTALQVGGGGKSFHPWNFTFFNYETVSFNEPQKVVQVESVTEVPFESQCRLALSTLLQQAEKSPKQFHYAKFPFGLMDVHALKILLAFYDKRSEQKKVQEEKRWLTRNVISPFSKTSVSLSDMSSFFSQI